MPQGLSVGRLIRATVNLSPLAAQRRGFGILLIAGDSNVINGTELFRTYTTLDAVASDFGTTAPEYLAAQLYFGQTPKPRTLMIGRWLRTASSAQLRGGVLTAAEQVLASWTAITTGSMAITIDGVVKTLSALNFASQVNMNGVASVVTTALGAAGTCVWDGDQFIITSSTTGLTSTITYATATGSGVDVSAKLKFTVATSSAPSPGFAAQTPVAAVANFANKSAVWFGLNFAAATMPTDVEAIAVAGLIEGLDLERMYGVTITNTQVLDPLITDDLASSLKALSYKRTCTQYSANPYAISSMFGRAFSVNFNANRSTITLMYKVEPGVIAEFLDETQATTLKDKNCNVFVNYVNDTAIIQYGKMASGAYFDEIHGLSWFKDALQNSEYNLLYQSGTKVPQTKPGQNQLLTVAAGACEEAVNNGLAAPGTWNSDGFGQLAMGDYLPLGYYIYTQPIDLQEQSIRETRTAPPIQIALKLAGAFQELDLIVNVNR